MSGDRRPLTIWVIYDHPADFPREFVARRWEGDQVTDDIILAGKISQLRDTMRAKGLTCLDRHRNDDPVIVETWL